MTTKIPNVTVYLPSTFGPLTHGPIQVEVEGIPLLTTGSATIGLEKGVPATVTLTLPVSRFLVAPPKFEAPDPDPERAGA